DTAGALVAGLLFAVHPVHVEAVANVVGRSELMATLFTVLAVYAGVARQHPGWSAAALAFGLLSKENAAVAPALVVWAWMIGLDRPDRRRMISLLVGWVVVGAAYAAVRTLVRQPFGGYASVAPMFIGQSPLTVRLTAVAALADVVRLLVFPLTLRVDSPDSYGGPVRRAGVYLDRREPAKALAAVRIAAGIMPRDPWVYSIGSVAAFALGDARAADSLLARLERFCSGPCAAGYYR